MAVQVENTPYCSNPSTQSGCSTSAVQGGPPFVANDFVLSAPQGFGDRQNTWPWAMQWWNGHLYVGTNRAYFCAEAAALTFAYPDRFVYPPPDPDVECTADSGDLPLQAEIWRWTPETDGWERVYQSPNTVPIPSKPGKFVGRDYGFRGMTVFTEADGTEALYVGAVSPGWLGYTRPTPPPRILRSTDGRTFAPIPQQPGTVMGNIPAISFRNLTSFNGRLYVQAGPVQGSGFLLEATNPERGNNSFRLVSPKTVRVSSVAFYNEALYLGVRDTVNGYSVIKTDTTGAYPYTYTTIVEPSAGVLPENRPNSEAVSMQVFGNRLYIGANGINVDHNEFTGAAELIRINPDDSWDVVVGDPRMTSTGQKNPISGYWSGFGNFFNMHIWRMEVHDDQLYVGTFDSSTTLKEDPIRGPRHLGKMGFDLYRTADGTTFRPITTTGFGDKFTLGVRALESTPYGLFLGGANPYYGLQIWRAAPAGATGNTRPLPPPGAP